MPDWNQTLGRHREDGPAVEQVKCLKRDLTDILAELSQNETAEILAELENDIINLALKDKKLSFELIEFICLAQKIYSYLLTTHRNSPQA